MRRRDFLKAGALALGDWRALESTGRAPRFRFLQFNDTHVQAPIPDSDKDPNLPTYGGANERMRRLVEAIQREKPDFVVGVGDLIHGERLDRLAPDLRTFRELIQPLGRPFYPAPGNHEVVQREGNLEYEKPYRETFGNERVSYTFRIGGILFIMLNNSGAAMGVTEEARKARNEWLKEALGQGDDAPKILCCHVPLVPVREEAVLAKSFGFRSYIAHDADLLDLVRAHAKTIPAVLSGHLHLTGAVQDQGVYHIVPSGTASYPHDYAFFEVLDDRIRVRMKGLPERLAAPDTNIHGARRHKVDYTDKAHSTPALYLRGGPGERDFEIALKGNRR